MEEARVKRLGRGDRDLARRLFAMMSDVFDEPHHVLGDDYVDELLAREDFWAVAALVDGEPVGGITAHRLPLTTAEASELFIYDVAVRPEHQRRGVGRKMLQWLRAAAADAGIGDAFVAAEVEDEHAVQFYRALGGESLEATFFTFAEE